jgi:hypothetical protein
MTDTPARALLADCVRGMTYVILQNPDPLDTNMNTVEDHLAYYAALDAAQRALLDAPECEDDFHDGLCGCPPAPIQVEVKPGVWADLPSPPPAPSALEEAMDVMDALRPTPPLPSAIEAALDDFEEIVRKHQHNEKEWPFADVCGARARVLARYNEAIQERAALAKQLERRANGMDDLTQSLRTQLDAALAKRPTREEAEKLVVELLEAIRMEYFWQRDGKGGRAGMRKQLNDKIAALLAALTGEGT